MGGKDLKVKKEEIIPIRGNVQRLFGRRKLGKFQKLEEVSSGAEQITEKVTFWEWMDRKEPRDHGRPYWTDRDFSFTLRARESYLEILKWRYRIYILEKAFHFQCKEWIEEHQK